MKNLLKYFKKDKYLNKTVIHFSTHGCIGTEHNFEWIGIIIGKLIKFDNKLFYKVKILKNKYGGELRDGNLKREFEEIPSWYLQNLGGDFFITYD